MTIFFSDTKGKVRKVNVLYWLLVFSTFPCPLLFSEVGSLDLYFLESFASRVQLQIAQMKGIHRRFGRGREAEVITLLDLTYHHTLIFSSSPLDLFAVLKHSKYTALSGNAHLIILLPRLFFPQISTWLSSLPLSGLCSNVPYLLKSSLSTSFKTAESVIAHAIPHSLF